MAVDDTLWRVHRLMGVGMTECEIRARGELDALPGSAVVYDNSCQIYQKLPAHNATGEAWFTPGDARAYSAGVIELPAWLLDDGL